MNVWSGPPPLRDNQQRWHYHFAHVALRAFAFAEPDLTVLSLTDTKGAQRLIGAVLTEVAESYELDEQQVRALARGFAVTVRRDGGLPVCVITMPPPQKAPDCYLIGIVSLHDGGVEYFTLERATKSGTMLCGWDAKGVHLNYGGGPSPDVDAFVARITELRHA
jgi:hypothetical protein